MRAAILQPPIPIGRDILQRRLALVWNRTRYASGWLPNPYDLEPYDLEPYDLEPYDLEAYDLEAYDLEILPLASRKEIGRREDAGAENA